MTSISSDKRITKQLIASVETVCERHGRQRVNGKVASERTFRMQKEVMRQFARALHGAGYMIDDADSLAAKHIDAVFDVWVKDKGLSTKTLQNQKSRIKQFCHWLGKPQLAEYVGQIESRYPDLHPQGFKVKTVAEKSKSWRGAGVDLNALIAAAVREDARFGAMLMLERSFGLRKKEVLLLNPWQANKGDYLFVRENIAKGGRPRKVPIVGGAYGDLQKQVIDFAKKHCKRGENMAWPGMTFEQAQRRYYHLCARIGLTKEDAGMTGHGLRAGFAEDMMLQQGVLPSVLGGAKEMSDKGVRELIKLATSQAMGHNRKQITHAYYGQDKRIGKASPIHGYQLGEPIKISKQSQAVLWLNEKPMLNLEGEGYKLSDVQIQTAYVSVQIVSDDQEVGRLSLGQFLDEQPAAEDGVAMRLAIVGLGLGG